MKKKRTGRATQQANGKRRIRTYLLMLVCGAVLVSGFFFAARQHFSSMDLGMKNSKLRRQIDELQAEKRRLLLAKETSLSPSELKKAAKKAGVGEPSEATPTEVSQITATGKDKAAQPVKDESAAASLIVKTAMTSPTASSVAAVAKIDKQQPKPAAKRTLATE